MTTERPVVDDDDEEAEGQLNLEEYLYQAATNEGLNVEEYLSQAAADERARFLFAKLKVSLTKEEFEGYAASKIAAMFRGRCARYYYKDILTIKDNMRKRICQIIRSNNCQRLDRKSLAFNMKSLTMPHTVWRNYVASIIQTAWRSNIQKIKSRYTPLEGTPMYTHVYVASLGW